MMAMREHCARYQLEVEAIKTHPVFVQFLEKNMELYRRIERKGIRLYLQDPIRAVMNVYTLFETLSVSVR